jgi:hypothetical protein
LASGKTTAYSNNRKDGGCEMIHTGLRDQPAKVAKFANRFSPFLTHRLNDRKVVTTGWIINLFLNKVKKKMGHR